MGRREEEGGGGGGVSHLLGDAVHLLVLGRDLTLHVDSHVAQITHNAAHLRQVLVHLVLTGVIRYPEMRGEENTNRGGNITNYRLCLTL